MLKGSIIKYISFLRQDFYRHKKGIKPIYKDYHERKVVSISDTETKFQEITGKKLDWSREMLNYINCELTQKEEFIAIRDNLANLYGESIIKMSSNQEPKIGATNYLIALSFYILNKKISDNKIEKIVDRFIEEIKGINKNAIFQIRLKGINLKLSGIRSKINSKVYLREINKSDYSQNISYLNDILNTPLNFPFIIMTIKKYSEKNRIMNEYIIRLIRAMRLFQANSIYYLSITEKSNSIIGANTSGTSLTGRSFNDNNSLILTSSIFKKFCRFINIVETKINFDDSKAAKIILIALDRYDSAVLDKNSDDKRLMTAVMGLEALFTCDNENSGELSYRLKIRIAKMLSCFGINYEEVMSNVNRSYKFRSKVVHGDYIDESEQKQVSELLPIVINYLRISLLTFILNSDLDKNMIIKIIEKSFMISKGTVELRKMTSKYRKLFNIER